MPTEGAPISYVLPNAPFLRYTNKAQARSTITTSATPQVSTLSRLCHLLMSSVRPIRPYQPLFDMQAHGQKAEDRVLESWLLLTRGTTIILLSSLLSGIAVCLCSGSWDHSCAYQCVSFAGKTFVGVGHVGPLSGVPELALLL